jgi:2-C-methyl-D-erythritol 4-phosphate cytidylyltransferase / 2-C-methyl-D-erythritol 2,4-cyclodiphosphate synthase
MADCIALVVAAGRGTRLNGARPKQYLPLGGKPLLRHALETLGRHAGIAAVRVVYQPADEALYRAAVAGLDLMAPVAGGERRQDSVRVGLESLADAAPACVLIHDAARPFVDAATIDRVLAALADAPGAIPAVALADTVKRAADGRIAATLERQSLWRAQTPQGFRYDAIRAAHLACAGADLPDDAAVAERAGLAVALVAGSEDNVKITTADDLARAERFLAARQGDVRIGQGFDVHGFGPGDHVDLCGVRIPHERALVGHSDADVGLHALADAILGALGAGDIGLHFPSGDPRWRAAPSHLFVSHAAALAAAAGGVITHVDVTIVCERPRVAPHRDAMVRRIAAILAIDPGRVSVKATTTDGLGFTGRGEGIAASAVATLRLPL